MTYKAALAGLAHGGGKSVLIRPSRHFDRVALFRAFGQFVEDLGGHYITAEDSGTGLEDMEVIRTVTKHVTGVDVATAARATRRPSRRSASAAASRRASATSSRRKT